ncbi:MAG: hypothetical protein F4053_15765 [Proteobacteria bacterium]|nr:hypothetical protein [Pseudomonadota bacterium]
MTLAGFIALGALITGLFAWLRQDIRELRKDMDSKFSSLRNELDSKISSLRNGLDSKIGSLRNDLEGKIDSRIDSLRSALESKIDSLDSKIGELSERVARIEGLLEAVFMRRDLTPFPEPPPSGDRPDKPRAA